MNCVRKIFILGYALFFTGMQLRAQQAAVTPEVEKIHKACFTVDTHADLPDYAESHPGFDITQEHDYASTGSQIDFPLMKKGGMDAMFFAVYLEQGDRTTAGNRQAEATARRLFALIHHIADQYPDRAGIATTPKQAFKLKKQGKEALFIGIENGWAIGDNLSLLKTYYDMGARYITLSHMKNNDICDSATDSLEHHGLSPFGEKVVAEMNRLGIMVDISHTSDSTFYDALRISKAPIIASHSSCRALCDHPRNMSDDMIKALAQKGGVIQINFFTDYLKTPLPNPKRDSLIATLEAKYGNDINKLNGAQQRTVLNALDSINNLFPDNRADIKIAADHIDHVVKLVGVDYVGIGADLDGGGGINGVNTVGDYKNITAELVRRGYSKKDLKKIWSGNIFRVMRQVEKTAKKLQKES